jgi:hypothetical protein
MSVDMLNRVVRVGMLVGVVAWGIATAAEAQVLGTFRWRTEPFCNVLTLTVTQQTSDIFTLDGFEEQCGGNPRQPVHGIAVPQVNGTITLGLNVVMLPAGKPVNIEAGIGLASLSGTWRDSAGNSGALTFGPTQTSGGPRTGPIEPAPLPSTFFATPNGNFVVVGGPQADVLPISGPGVRMVWHAAKSAFRAGQATGTQWNDASIGAGSVAFGVDTIASGSESAAFGFNNRASGLRSMAGGELSIASGAHSLAIGFQATAAATGSVALGALTTATGFGSVALGRHAISQGAGSFTYGDASTDSKITSGTNEFNVRAAGGFGFYTNSALTTGVELAPNASQFTFLSDANAKEHFRDLDADDLLAKIARMPVQEWSYKAQGQGIRHVGPTAQDFRAAFGLGEHPLRIGALDADGINLAAVKALEARTRASDERRQALELELATLRTQVDELTRIVAALGMPRQ